MDLESASRQFTVVFGFSPAGTQMFVVGAGLHEYESRQFKMTPLEITQVPDELKTAIQAADNNEPLTYKINRLATLGSRVQIAFFNLATNKLI
jgi:hypothetical protein